MKTFHLAPGLVDSAFLGNQLSRGAPTGFLAAPLALIPSISSPAWGESGYPFLYFPSPRLCCLDFTWNEEVNQNKTGTSGLFPGRKIPPPNKSLRLQESICLQHMGNKFWDWRVLREQGGGAGKRCFMGCLGMKADFWMKIKFLVGLFFCIAS